MNLSCAGLTDEPGLTDLRSWPVTIVIPINGQSNQVSVRSILLYGGGDGKYCDSKQYRKTHQEVGYNSNQAEYVLPTSWIPEEQILNEPRGIKIRIHDSFNLIERGI